MRKNKRNVRLNRVEAVIDTFQRYFKWIKSLGFLNYGFIDFS